MSLPVLAFVATLMSHGCQLPCAAGVIANMEAESSLRPCIAGPSGLGLRQLMGDRRRRFLAWAGGRWCDPEMQWDFMRVELREQGLRDIVFSAGDAAEAARVIMLEDERPRSKDPRFRMWRAQLWYSYLYNAMGNGQ